MQRKWAVHPDRGDQMSREALIGALVDAATVLDIAGGCLEVVVGRAPTTVPGEMVMTGAVLCWRDRTDARPQAEQALAVVPEPDAGPEMGVREHYVETVAKFDRAQISEDSPPAQDPDATRDPDDGFDYSQMPEEDVENEPLAAR